MDRLRRLFSRTTALTAVVLLLAVTIGESVHDHGYEHAHLADHAADAKHEHEHDKEERAEAPCVFCVFGSSTMGPPPPTTKSPETAHATTHVEGAATTRVGAASASTHTLGPRGPPVPAF